MQIDLASMLQQKSHLAALGLAVSKINHDLRNLLTSAQLFSERLATISDPHVQRFAPKLMRALERAIAFCQSTLSYGRVQEPPPDRRSLALEPLVEEVRETLGLEPDGAPIRWIGAVERGAHGRRRSRSAVPHPAQPRAQRRAGAREPRRPSDPGRDQVRVTGRREGAVVVIEVSDTGPGVSEQARAHLFEAFQGSTRTGSAGLGLAIAAELVRAHGGDIRLVEGTIGATFRAHHPGPRGRAQHAPRRAHARDRDGPGVGARASHVRAMQAASRTVVGRCRMTSDLILGSGHSERLEDAATDLGFTRDRHIRVRRALRRPALLRDAAFGRSSA